MFDDAGVIDSSTLGAMTIFVYPMLCALQLYTFLVKHNLHTCHGCATGLFSELEVYCHCRVHAVDRLAYVHAAT